MDSKCTGSVRITHVSSFIRKYSHEFFRCSWSWWWTGRLADVAGNSHQVIGPGSRNPLTGDGQLEVASLALSDRSRIRHNFEGLEGKSGLEDNGVWKMSFNLLSYRFERLLT